MPTQTTFLGASITGFNTSLGWGGQLSTLTVNLVEDSSNGDDFVIPDVGQPARFIYEGFSFGGIVQKWVANGSLDGNPTYQVILNDPRELLNGVQLVVNNYTGTTYNIPNLYNIYGYWENTIGYGTSQVNEGGMPWKKVRDAFLVLQQTNPIYLKTVPFTIDVSNLPNMPDYYRVGGGQTSITLMDFISSICDDSARDFFFNLETNNVIKLYTVDRSTQPQLGLIASFISQTSGAVSKEVGVELRNETTSKFLVGGKVSRLYLNEWSDGEPEDMTIHKYWGLDANGNVILPKDKRYVVNGVPVVDEAGDPIFYKAIELDTRVIEVWGVGETYDTDGAEMRAVLAGFDNWTAFLALKAMRRAGQARKFYSSPHALKLEQLNIFPSLSTASLARVLDPSISAEELYRKVGELVVHDTSPLTGRIVKGISESLGRTHEENIKILYDFLRKYAEEYYGRKYMVRIPFVLAARDSETLEIKTTLEPTEAGFVTDQVIASGVQNNQLPVDYYKLQTPDGRFNPYVRFTEADWIDSAQLNSEDYALGANFVAKRKPKNLENLSLFVKCDIGSNIVYKNRSTFESPRAVISLPGYISYLYTNPDLVSRLSVEDATSIGRSAFDKLLKDEFVEAFSGIYGVADAAESGRYNYLLSRVGAERLFFGGVGIPVTPSMAAVPLLSNILTYGPWYATGANGKTEFEQDDSLVPWNYGGFDLMNLAAQSRVTDSLSNQTDGEGGSIEVPGSPAINLGGILISGGPYVTGVEVTVGTNGVRTTYRMETWTQRFGRISKSLSDRANRISKAIRDQRRNLIEWNRQAGAVPNAALGSSSPITINKHTYNIDRIPAHRSGHTSSPYLVSELIPISGGTYKNVTTIAPSYNVPAMIGGPDYSGKAMVSLDALFVPFSTHKTKFWHLPHFETPTASGSSGRSVDELNPYASGNNTYTILQGDKLYGSGISPDLHVNDMQDEWKRPIAFKTPMILCGWGYDSDGKPVPNASSGTPGDNFATNYLSKPNLWKTGPLDVKWSNTRKVWETGGGQISVATLVLDLYGGGTASGYLFNLLTNSNEGSLVKIRDILGDTYGRYVVVPSGYKALVMPERTSSDYIVLGAQPR